MLGALFHRQIIELCDPEISCVQSNTFTLRRECQISEAVRCEDICSSPLGNNRHCRLIFWQAKLAGFLLDPCLITRQVDVSISFDLTHTISQSIATVVKFISGLGTLSIMTWHASKHAFTLPIHNCYFQHVAILQHRVCLTSRISQKLDAKMATPNLHTLVCQLGVQERERGDTVNESELWVERNIQLCKRIVRFKATSCPEKIIGNLELLRRAQLRCRFATAATLKDGAELWAAHQLKLKKLRGGVARALSSAYDPCRDDNTSAFPDKGKKVTSIMMTVIRPLLVKYLEKHPAENQGRVPDVDHVQGAPLSSLNAYVHTLVWIDGQLCITSVDYKRQKSAQSFWVLIECEKHGQSYHQPGRVSRYLRLSLPDGQDGQPRTLRVALVDFWTRPASNPVWGNANTGPGVHRLFFKPDPADKECVVALDSIVRPVIHTSNMVKSAGNGAQKKLMLFVGYDHLSGLKVK